MGSETGVGEAALRERFQAAGQGHVFDGVDALGTDARGAFLAELAAVDLDLVTRQRAILESSDEGAAPRLEPPDMWSGAGGAEEEARARGAELLRAGRVGFVLVAGGQGSRLGFDGPKGAFEIGPVTAKTLFEWHAARIIAAGERHRFRPTWYVMTSRANDAATREVFAGHGHFGFPEEDLVFFSQEMIPALDLEGRIVLAAPGKLFLAPNGHGGTLAALRSSGALEHMAGRGIDELSYFQVDNPLSRPADEVFLGAHSLAGADMSAKVVPKRDAAEKVGVLGKVDGALGCIEYSDLSDELRHARDDGGTLLFNAGNIAVHAIARSFVERLTEGGGLDLPWHVARKRISAVGPDGTPREIDGVKFETFVFDALGKARASVTMEVERSEEFSPVKNAEGSDSPATCRGDLASIGAALVGDTSGRPVEVDPRAGETTEEIEARAAELVRREVDGGLVVEPPGSLR